MNTSLVDRVQGSLTRSKVTLGVAFSNTFKVNVSDDTHAQAELNKYFRVQLAKAPVSTIDERGCLLDTVSPDTWFKYFETHVLPTLVRFNLPQE